MQCQPSFTSVFFLHTKCAHCHELFSVCAMEPPHKASLHFRIFGSSFFLGGGAGNIINQPLDNPGIFSSCLKSELIMFYLLSHYFQSPAKCQFMDCILLLILNDYITGCILLCCLINYRIHFWAHHVFYMFLSQPSFVYFSCVRRA